MPTYDLTHALEGGMPVYPGDPPVEIEPTATVESDGYRTARLALPSHAGTHVDAPSHLLADGRTIDDVSPETFRFSATVADLRPLEPRAAIGVDALATAAERDDGGSLGESDIVVVRTGWERRWGADRYLDHPYLSVDAAERIVDAGCHLAVDTPNPDPTPTARARNDEPDGFPAHDALFDADRVIVENLRGLDRAPDSFELHAYPLPIADGDGSPVRAVAVVDR